MLHTPNNINNPAEHFQLLLNVFSIFNIRIWYDDTIVTENVPDNVWIMCLNCGKTIGCLLHLKKIRLHHSLCQEYGVPKCWFILDHPVRPKTKSYFQHHCPSWILNGAWYKTKICSWLNVWHLKIMLQLLDETDIIWCVQLRFMAERTQL